MVKEPYSLQHGPVRRSIQCGHDIDGIAVKPFRRHGTKSRPELVALCESVCKYMKRLGE